jgi:Flp pilus assembly protein TadD
VRGGDFAAAARVLLLAIEKFPYLPAPYERLAACYLGAGEQAKASGILRRGLELFPADKHLLQLAQKSQQP